MNYELSNNTSYDISEEILITVLLQEQSCYNPSEFLNLIYADRMRTIEDKSKVFHLTFFALKILHFCTVFIYLL